MKNKVPFPSYFWRVNAQGFHSYKLNISPLNEMACQLNIYNAGNLLPNDVIRQSFEGIVLIRVSYHL